MVDVRGDVLRPPHGTTPAAVKSNIKSELRSFKSNENIHKKENLFMPYATNKGADQSAHPHSLIIAFVVRNLDSIIPLFSKSKISSL